MDMTTPTFRPTKLNERAMLIKLTIRRATIMKRDDYAESFVQEQLNDASLIVNSKLFRDPGNPVNQIMSTVGRVYSYHKQHTTENVMTKGTRILPMALYMDYMQAMREQIANVDAMMARHMPHYDQYVQDDIKFRSEQAVLKGVPPRAKVEDYPSADDFQSRMSIQLIPMPLPDRSHILFDLPQEDLDAFDRMQEQMVATARADVIARMLEPLKHLVDKLAVPIGEKGAIFRDSAIENVIEGIELARKLNIDDNPEITAATRELLADIGKYDAHKEWLRESPIVRKQAHEKLAAIADKMAAFMAQ